MMQQVQAQDLTVGIADIGLFQWHVLSNELHAMASNKSSDHIGLTAEMFKFTPVEVTDILLRLLNRILFMVNSQTFGEPLSPS